MFLCLLSSNYEIPYLNTFLHYLLFVYPSQVYNSRAPTALQVSRVPDTITCNVTWCITGERVGTAVHVIVRMYDVSKKRVKNVDNYLGLMAVAIERLSRALKKKKEEVGRASKPSNVAAIDFGTTSVSLAYTTERDDKINTFFIDQIHERVPNAILLEKMNDGTCEVKEFGTRAQDAYTKIRNHQNYVYFERIKMLLERDEVTPNCTALVVSPSHHFIGRHSNL